MTGLFRLIHASLSVGSGAFSGSTVQITVTGAPANTTVLGTTTVKYTNQGSSTNSITDGSNSSATSSVITLSDEAKPVIVSAVTGDNNSDGTVDRLTLTFSESVVITDGVTDNDITLSASTGSASITAGSYGATASTLVYTISGATAGNTSLTIDPTYAVSGAGDITDPTGNEMANSETVSGSDGAAPILLSATYKDTNGDGTVNRIDAVYSEAITSSTFESSDWTFPANPASLSVGSGAFSGSTVQITVTGAPANTTVLGTTTVKYTNQGSSPIA